MTDAVRQYLAALSVEATRLESHHNAGPGFWKGLANKAAIARLDARRLQRELSALERQMETIR